MPATELLPRVEAGALVVDTRAASEFARAHVQGTINIPLDASFTTWACWLLPYNRDLYLIIDNAFPGSASTALRDLAMIGLDRVGGLFDASAIEILRASGYTPGTIAQISARELAAALRDGALQVIDVRGQAEWLAGHLPGAHHIPLGYLADQIEQLPVDQPVVLQCQAGARSAIAASVLKARGRSRVLNLTGGIAAWRAAGLPVVQNTAN